MNGDALPHSWREYIDDIDRRLTEKGAPAPVRSGIAQDVADHLHQMAAGNPDLSRDHLPALLDPPEAYAEAFAEAMSFTPEAKNWNQPVRLRECRSHHGEDGNRRIHICGNCLRVFHGCSEYETHICDDDFRRDGKYVPYWTHEKRWAIAVAIAMFGFVPILWLVHGFLTKDSGSGSRRRYHEYSNYRYLKELSASLVMFQVRERREPESLQELSASGIWNSNWVMPGNLKDLGSEGGFAIEQLYYIHAAGMNMSLVNNRQPWLVLSYRQRHTNAICYAVAYTNGDVMNYATLGEFLTDWETKQ